MTSEVKKFIKYHSEEVPDFFLPPDGVRHYCFDLLQQIFILISKIAKRKVVENITIYNLLCDIEGYLEAIKIAESDIEIHSRKHLIYSLELFEKIAASSDEYEIAQNMLRLREMLKK
jgi:hypothetical protein